MTCEAAVSIMESRMAHLESVIAPGERSPALAHVRQEFAAVAALPIPCAQADVVQVSSRCTNPTPPGASAIFPTRKVRRFADRDDGHETVQTHRLPHDMGCRPRRHPLDRAAPRCRRRLHGDVLMRVLVQPRS